MKKISLMTLAVIALLLSAVAFAQRFESWAPSDAKDANAVSKQPAMTKMVPVQNASFRAPKSVTRRAIASVDELVGNYVAISTMAVYNSETQQLELDEVPVNGVGTVITKIDDTHIGITGLVTNATDAVTAEVNLTEGTLTIADGQTLFTNDTYGPIVMANASTEGAITASVTADGIAIDQIWCDLLGGDGAYAGYLWSGNYYVGTTLVKSNAVMAYTNASATFNNGPANVYVEQEGAVATVYNFANQGFVVNIDLKPTQEISIAKQKVAVGSTTTGAFYTYGVDGNSLLAEIVGTGTANVLTIPGSWTFYSDNNYWYNLYTETSITMNEGSTIAYPGLDIDISPATGTDISAAITEAQGTAAKLGNVKITLAKDGAYTLSAPIKAGGNITINGNGATIDASTGDNIIGIEGVNGFAKKADGTDSDHSLVNAITIKDVTIKGMTKALVRDLMTKTLLETLTIDNCVIQASNAKVVVDFDGRGYVGKVVVKNSTIWAAAGTGKHFAKYGSRPKNVNDGPLNQEFDVQNSTFVNIAANADFGGGANFNNFSQKGTANNIYTLKNNIFVNCGKNGQVVVGFNAGQTSSTPVWDVDKNAFNWNGADVAAAEVTKAGKKDDVDIVQNIVPGIVAFASETAIADGNFKLANCAQNTSHIGDPRWLDATVEPEAEDITISPASGDISDALFNVTGAVNKKAKNVTINLTADAAYTVTEPIVAGGSIAINGAAGATIDASALTAPFIQMSATPGVAANEKGGYPIDGITIKDVTITGVKAQLIYANKVKYLFGKILVENSVIGIDGTNKKTIFDFNGGGLPEDLTVNKSTIWANPSNAVNGGFYSTQSGSKMDDVGATKNEIAITNSTLYNIANGKPVSTLRQNSQTGQKYTVKNNIIVDCGATSNGLGQFLKGLNARQAGKDENWDVDGNIFNWGGANVVEDKVGSTDGLIKNSIEAVVTFTDAAAGDFNAQVGVPVVPADPIVVGDPRWTLTVAQAPFDIVVNAEDITEGDITAAIATASAGKMVKGITVNLAAETAYKVTAPIAADGDIVINGAAGATIDASALEGAMVTMTATEAPAEWTTLDNVSIKDVKITGLKTALYASTVKQYVLKNFTLDNSIVEVAADVTVFDFTKGSVVENFTINKSTLYSATATSKSLYSSQSGQKASEVSDDQKQVIKITNSTLYNFAKSKNFFSHRQANQKFFTYDIENNIFVDCGKSGQVIKGLNGGQGGPNPTWTIKGNVFNFNGADTSANEETGDSDHTGDETPGANETVQNSYAGRVIFTDAAAGDFNFTFLAAPETTAPTAVGDPRWTLTAGTSFTITIGEVKNGKVTAVAYAAEGEKIYPALTPDAGYDIDKMPVIKNAEGTDVTAQITFGDEELYFVMPAFNITVDYEFSKLYTITLPTETTNGTVTLVNHTDGKAVAGKEIKIKVADLATGYKVVAKSGETEIALETGDGVDHDYHFEMPEGDVTITIEVATGISTIAVDASDDIFSDGAPVYNLSGQRVFKGYKGIVIKNGKKIVIK